MQQLTPDDRQWIVHQINRFAPQQLRDNHHYNYILSQYVASGEVHQAAGAELNRVVMVLQSELMRGGRPDDQRVAQIISGYVEQMVKHFMGSASASALTREIPTRPELRDPNNPNYQPNVQNAAQDWGRQQVPPEQGHNINQSIQYHAAQGSPERRADPQRREYMTNAAPPYNPHMSEAQVRRQVESQMAAVRQTERDVNRRRWWANAWVWFGGLLLLYLLIGVGIFLALFVSDSGQLLFSEFWESGVGRAYSLSFGAMGFGTGAFLYARRKLQSPVGILQLMFSASLFVTIFLVVWRSGIREDERFGTYLDDPTLFLSVIVFLFTFILGAISFIKRTLVTLIVLAVVLLAVGLFALQSGFFDPSNLQSLMDNLGDLRSILETWESLNP